MHFDVKTLSFASWNVIFNTSLYYLILDHIQDLLPVVQEEIPSAPQSSSFPSNLVIAAQFTRNSCIWAAAPSKMRLKTDYTSNQQQPAKVCIQAISFGDIKIKGNNM